MKTVTPPIAALASGADDNNDLSYLLSTVAFKGFYKVEKEKGLKVKEGFRRREF